MSATTEPVVSTPTTPRLTELEAVIHRGTRAAARAFVEVGLALAEIRDEGLFAATHDTFKAYLRERWGLEQPVAYGHIYAAQVAAAIREHHGTLPAGISADALRPLVPLLNREGAAAVARAWGPIREHGAERGRPPSRSEVRAALVDQGLVTVADPKPRPVQMGTVRDGLLAAAERVSAMRERFGSRPLSPKSRRAATECAAIARRLAVDLEALADVKVAAERLAAAEGPRPSESDLCVGHGARRDADGVCAWCRRPDVAPRQANGTDRLAA